MIHSNAFASGPGSFRVCVMNVDRRKASLRSDRFVCREQTLSTHKA